MTVGKLPGIQALTCTLLAPVFMTVMISGVTEAGVPAVAGDEQPHRDKYSARMADLVVRVTGVGLLPNAPEWKPERKARAGYHYVAVSVKMKNVVNYPNCTRFFDVQLRVDNGYVYELHSHATYLPEPRTIELPAGEETEGLYTFEVKDGVKPVELLLHRNTMAEWLCHMDQHRSGRGSGATTVRLPLRGLPVPVNPTEQ